MQVEDVVVVGAGLAGLACAFELVKGGRKVTVLESRAVLGGRTSSWIDDDMPVESGLHKFLGVYRALPKLLEEAGAPLEEVVTWVDELTFLEPDGAKHEFVTAPYRHPLGTAASLLANNDLIPPTDKAKLAAMGAAGMARCVSDPHEFDQISIASYAAEFGVSEATIERVLSTSTRAILFLPAERFSAYAAFAPIVESAKNFMTARLGAFNGGMTDVMIAPIANAVVERGGEIKTGAAVKSLLVEDDRVRGVHVAGQELHADAVVLATPLAVAQQLLREPFSSDPWFEGVLSLRSLSAATIQFELSEPLLPNDGTHFSPTAMCCFAEQSRITFRETAGRCSVILYPPEEFIHLPADEVARRVFVAAHELALPLGERAVRYRIVNHAHDFYAMEPGSETLRPTQDTPVAGLYLAGDYTKQPFIASMEGAVISGFNAAHAILG